MASHLKREFARRSCLVYSIKTISFQIVQRHGINSTKVSLGETLLDIYTSVEEQKECSQALHASFSATGLILGVDRSCEEKQQHSRLSTSIEQHAGNMQEGLDGSGIQAQKP